MIINDSEHREHNQVGYYLKSESASIDTASSALSIGPHPHASNACLHGPCLLSYRLAVGLRDMQLSGGGRTSLRARGRAFPVTPHPAHQHGKGSMYKSFSQGTAGITSSLELALVLTL